MQHEQQREAAARRHRTDAADELEQALRQERDLGLDVNGIHDAARADPPSGPRAAKPHGPTTRH